MPNTHKQARERAQHVTSAFPLDDSSPSPLVRILRDLPPGTCLGLLDQKTKKWTVAPR